MAITSYVRCRVSFTISVLFIFHSSSSLGSFIHWSPLWFTLFCQILKTKSYNNSVISVKYLIIVLLLNEVGAISILNNNLYDKYSVISIIMSEVEGEYRSSIWVMNIMIWFLIFTDFQSSISKSPRRRESSITYYQYGVMNRL